MTPTDSAPPACPRCGSPLATDAPEGLCTRCLAAVNFDTDTLVSDSGPSPAVPPIEEIAPHFPQLEILSCLGRGGMGVVYKARQISLDRLVALKLLAPEREKDPEFSERFAREALALAKMSHPHIVTVHDFGQTGRFFYLLMEYVDGANLRQLLRSHRFTPEQALGVVPPLCDALQYAHDRGIVHRDIKPENLLMDRQGRLKVADFGLAKMLGTSASGDDRPVGTPAYMAPEQIGDPANVDNRADIYSLGVVIYEMLTGELPGPRLTPPSAKATIDSRLDDVVMRAMEQDPGQRYGQASILRTEVENITRTAAATSPPPSSPAAEISAAAEASPAIVQPAIAMLVTSLLAVASQLFGTLIGVTLLVFPMSFVRNFPLSMPHDSFRGGTSLIAVIIGFWMLVSLGLNIAAAIGALKMRRLQSHSWAMASAIILIFTGLLSVPAVTASSLGGLLALAQLASGIWGLVILQRPEVRAAFQSAHQAVVPAMPPPSPPATAEARKVSIPAIGLMVTAGLNFLALLLALGIAGLRALHSPNAWVPSIALPIVLLCGGALCAIIFAGGWRMRKLQNHTLAVIAAVLAIITPPGLMIGGIFGIWALVILFDRQVRSEFQSAKAGFAGVGLGCLMVILALLIAPAALLATYVTLSSSRSTVSYSSSPAVFMPRVPSTHFDQGAPDSTTPGMPASPEELAVRFETAAEISSFQWRNSAFAAVGRDAAASGNVPMTVKAIQEISEFQLSDDTRKIAALSLCDRGLRREATRIASEINGLNLQSETLALLATRPSPDPQYSPPSQPPAAPVEAAPAAALTEDLKARLEAIAQISAIATKDNASANLAKEAAETGVVTVALQAIDGISSINQRDQTSAIAAKALAKRSLRKEALQIATSISSIDLRDRTLAELSE